MFADNRILQNYCLFVLETLFLLNEYVISINATPESELH